jgi:hypothetical protein
MRQNILITALLLDSKNPRMEIQSGHRDAIRALFAEDPKFMLNLSEDIVNNGLNPLENIGISPGKDGRYIIREGNRRVAAVCALHSPDLVKGIMGEGLEKKLRRGLGSGMSIYLLKLNPANQDQRLHSGLARHESPLPNEINSIHFPTR